MDWSSDKIRKQLKNANADPSQIMDAYWQFYGLDFHRLGLATQAAYLLTSNNTELCVQQFSAKNERGKVLVLHGYYDHIGLYKYLIRECLELGLSVTAFDLPGHGLSSGARASIDSFDSYRDALESVLERENIVHGSRWSVVAQSTGSAILMDYLSQYQFNRDNSPFANVVLLAPLVRPEQWMKVKFMLTVLRPFVDSIARNYNENSHDKAFLKFVRYEDPLQHDRVEVDWVSALVAWVPVFEQRRNIDLSISVIQGTEDTTVDWKHNVAAIEKVFNEVSVHEIEGGRHHLVGESQEYRSEVFTYLRRSLSVID
jgi:alpha-beta hydrolase superfamily lysophospholipase